MINSKKLYVVSGVFLLLILPTLTFADSEDNEETEGGKINDKSILERRIRQTNPSPRNEERRVTHNELVSDIDHFSMARVEHYSEILFDPTNFQVLIGARDHLFRLSLLGLQLLESAEWGSKQDTIQMCTMKGQTTEMCHNYVRLLHMNKGKVYTCGTNSFKPICTWRGLTNIANTLSSEIGIGKAPFDPGHSVTSLMTSEEILYVGTSVDFHGNDGAFLRSRGDLRSLRSSKSNLKWLSEPNFVSSFESGGFIYFFFSENAFEVMNCGKRMYSRIGRVCRNDSGGSVVLKDNWTTFLKARLNCSRPGDYPFYYDNLQSVSYLPMEQLFYGVFTTHDNSLPGSAVCVFSMNSVNTSFDGPFKHQPSPSSTWGPAKVDDSSHFRCESPKSTAEDPGFLANKYQLMDEAVQPVTVSPVFTLDFSRLTHIAVDVVSTRQSGSVHVAFVASEDGTIRKLSLLSHTSSFVSSTVAPESLEQPTTCLLEVFEPFPNNSNSKILSMKFLKETNSLYIGTQYEVIRIPVGRCDQYTTRHLCLAARDPYCGWDTNILQCTTAPENNPLSSSWIQHVIGCPSFNEPVDGKWGPWSDWSVCSQSDSKDDCLCRHRKCNAPTPARGGSECTGVDTEVTNCTVHGDWTAWSAWSECSATCGIAAKTRRRSCTNPKPQHGGRVCVGLETQEIYCHSLPPCPKYTHLPVDGGWSNWSDWGECSASCGRGTRKRTRTCSQPPSQHGGKDCPGCETAVEECTGRKCSAVEGYSEWTPWGDVQSTPNEILQRRFRVECSAQMGRKGLIEVKAEPPMHEDRSCSLDGVCSDPFGSKRRKEGWSLWSSWSQCDKPCGGGMQKRTRTCEGSCSGSGSDERQCNIQKCEGTWSCWSEWTTCSISCGSGVQERSRQCVTSHDQLQAAEGCRGSPNEHQPCNARPCSGEEGWGPWDEWSTCDGQDERVRRRRCLSNQPSRCRGLDLQKMSCDLSEINDEPTFLEARTNFESVDFESCTSVHAIIGACIACFLLGALVGGFALYTTCVKKRQRKIPSSPHYISAKPNHYVSVPKGDWKGGPSSADSQPLNSPTISIKNGLKNSIRNVVMTTLPLKEFDTATIKRSSHGSYGNGHIRADLDSDNIFFS